MGKDRNETSGRSPKPSKNGNGPNGGSVFLSIHPTMAEKESIQNDKYTATDSLAILGQKIEEGLKLSITYSSDRDAFCVMVYEKDGAWNESPKLTAFHKNLNRAITIMGLGLETRYSTFPAPSATGHQAEFDW